MKRFNLPINDERIQSLTLEQLDFMILSEQADNPVKESNDNYYYDPEFDNMFDNWNGQDEDDRDTAREFYESYLTEDDKEDGFLEI